MTTDRERRRRRAIARRRRTAALLALLVVLALVVVALAWRPWESTGEPDADADASVAPTPSASATPTPSSTQRYTPIGGIPESGDGSAACTPDQVLITPITDAVTYAAEQPVEMSFQIQNVSGAPCRLNVGTTQQAYEIRTGEQVVFRSSDCPVDQVDQIVELEPGVPQRTIPVAWDRTASSPETCASPRDPVVAGGASYHLSVTVSGIESASEQQIILG